MSSSGDDGGGYFPGMAGAASPMPGLPVAGANSVVGDPYKYGKFQQFLPDDLIHETGRNDNATGLRPDMFRYRGPGGEVDGGAGPGAVAAGAGAGAGGGDLSGQIQGLRDQLAQLQASSQASQQANNVTWPGGRQRIGNDPIETWVNAS
jgi:hypothetical protein